MTRQTPFGEQVAVVTDTLFAQMKHDQRAAHASTFETMEPFVTETEQRLVVLVRGLTQDEHRALYAEIDALVRQCVAKHAHKLETA